MRTRTCCAVIGTMVGAVLLAAGCGADNPPQATPSAAGPTSATTPTATATPPSTAPATPVPAPSAAPTVPPITVNAGGTPTCRTGQLRVRLAATDGGGTAGSRYRSIVFTNEGSTSCAIYGWPGVSYVGNGNGTQFGAAADRTGSPTVVRLRPRQHAAAQLRAADAGNFGAACKIGNVDGLRIYPPNQKGAVFIALPGTACRAPSVHSLTIGPVTVR